MCASTLAVTAMSTTLTRTFGTASRRSVETMGPSRSRRRRAAPGFWTAFDGAEACGMLGGAAGLIAAAGDNDDGELAMLWSVISAPPVRAGAALETKRLQGIGWLRLNPIALRMAKLGYVYLCRTVPQRMFSMPCLRNFHELEWRIARRLDGGFQSCRFAARSLARRPSGLPARIQHLAAGDRR